MFHMQIIPVFRPFCIVFYNMVQDVPYLSSFFLNHSSVAGCFCCFWFLTMSTGEKPQCGPLHVGKKYFFMTVICDVNNSHGKILFSTCRRWRNHCGFSTVLIHLFRVLPVTQLSASGAHVQCRHADCDLSARFPEPQPLDDAGLFSYLMLSWLSPLMVRGLQRCLDESNIPSLSVHDAADKNAKR